MIENIRC